MTLGYVAQSAAIYCIDQNIIGPQLIPAAESSGYILYVVPVIKEVASHGQFVELVFYAYENQRLLNADLTAGNFDKALDSFMLQVWYRAAN